MMPPLMRRALAVLALALAGCPSTTVVSDLAIVTGCHQPEACMLEACGCNRGDVQQGGGCVACWPSISSDTCGTCAEGDAGHCREPSQVCYGRGPECPGAGATCVPAGTDFSDGGIGCGAPEAAPPEPVQSEDGDGGVTTVFRCAYADDICCPGHARDLGVPDLATGPDLSAVVPMDLASSD